ncbi:MAG: hypothetical protein ABSG65_35990 [Bryobacteraceae bacterium]
MDLRKLWSAITARTPSEDFPSPMPSVRYDFWNGDWDLTDPVENGVDRELRTFFTGFAASPEAERAAIRARIRSEQFGELKWHAMRSAVFAIRNADPEWVQSGLAAVAATDSARFLTVWMAASFALLYHAGKLVCPAVEEQFLRAASLSDGVMAEGILAFMQCPAERKQLRSAGEEEVRTETGTGFVMWRGGRYDPSYDLKKGVLAARRMVASDRYEPVAVSIGGWLPERLVQRHSASPSHITYLERGTALADALRGNRASASVFGKLRPGHHPAHELQSLNVTLAECADEPSARFLLERFQSNGLGIASIGVSVGPLLGLMTASPTRQGVKSYETAESLWRFAKGLTGILTAAARP